VRDTITLPIRMPSSLVARIDAAVNPLEQNRTQFVRAAIREKLERLARETATIERDS
jgi:metal-responsive CopG/Arc/MetJ family transcriptional regulator